MGFLDSFLPGGRPSLKPLPVSVGGVIGAWSAGHTVGGLSLAGGGVVLGTNWLVFSPWDMDRTRAWLVKWLGKAGVPHLSEVDKLISATNLLEPVAIPLSEIASARVLDEGSLLKPPQVRLALASGRHFDIGILASPHHPNPHPANRVAMTDFLEKLLAQLNGGGAAPRTPAPDSSQVRPEQPQPVAPATPLRAYDGLVNASPMARSVAMDQLRRWKEVLTPGEFVTSKARKLAEVGLTASSPPQTLPVSPMSQQLAIDQVTQFASLVTEGILTEGEYQTVRNVILREHGLA